MPLHSLRAYRVGKGFFIVVGDCEDVLEHVDAPCVVLDKDFCDVEGVVCGAGASPEEVARMVVELGKVSRVVAVCGGGAGGRRLKKALAVVV